jgi:hypothetical protein
MGYAPTAHNRTVYASPPVGGSGFRSARSIATLIPTPHSTHILSALVFAAQSPYPGRQNVVNSRNVMRNAPKNFMKLFKKVLSKYRFYGNCI